MQPYSAWSIFGPQYHVPYPSMSLPAMMPQLMMPHNTAQTSTPHPFYMNPAQNSVQQSAFPHSNSHQVQSIPSSEAYTNHMASTPAPQALYNLYLNSDLTPATNWYPDSIASDHVTPNGGNIPQHLHFEGPDQIYISNGQGLSISSIGTSNFTTPLHTSFTLTLHNLLHVPTITRNLLSVSKFAKDNEVIFEFHTDTCLVKLQATKEVLFRGSLDKDGL
jgi:hypothetical protein